MAQNGHRQVSIARDAVTKYTATNERGGTIAVGSGGDADFTPVELLLVAIGACTAIDVDIVTSRRAEPVSFTVDVEGEKIRDEHGNRMTDLVVTYRVSFPEGEDGDAARGILPDIVRRSHQSLCTVSKTVEFGTPVSTVIAPTA